MADRAPIDVRLADLWVGTLYRKPAAVTERIAFRYADEWLAARDAFALDPELFLDARTTAPARGGVFGAFADCAPDRWGRRLMQRRERLTAETEGRAVRTLSELDYVLGVSDASRMGALRFFDGATYLAPGDDVPPLVRLGDLLAAADRVTEQREGPEELALLLAPGSALGGARPKASVRDTEGLLATGSLKLAKETAGYFDLDARAAERITAEVLHGVADWERVARMAGASKGECGRMKSAFLTV